MPEFKVILFMCNWGPHAAYQELQDRAAEIPPEIQMVRIPCSGRISKALLFKAFEMGADGVLLLGCETGTCRYGTGTATALKNVEDTRGILALLGLGADRLRFASFMPDEAEALLEFLQTAISDIRAIGPSPVTPPVKRSPILEEAETIRQVVAAHDVYACQDCGKCSSACSLTLSGKPFSPRAIAGAVINGEIASQAVRDGIWSCLTCGLCYDRCPSAVDFPLFIRDMRNVLSNAGLPGFEAHGGFFQSLMRTMTSPGVRPRHYEWLSGDIKTDHESKILFFGGCAPYFDIFYRNHLGVETARILKDAIRLLNFFDIYPQILEDERCCGHDLLWSGDRESFRKLARLNVDRIREAGVEEVVTACPECYRTLATDYPAEGVEVPFRVVHLFEILDREIEKGAVEFKGPEQILTFQDPCRLSRLENRPELPRKLLARLESWDFREMPDSGRGAICCGNTAWIGCDAFSKALQARRLRQARETGSDLLVTACPKCQIHLKCAMEDPFQGEDLQMPLRDLTSILADAIQWA
ncbi:MAG: hydrogenase iron-sulfur subunit [Deltaproteobacteria bacterium]|nr:hydrogenase iron-sulfur subunit [Deltaproteobacteria bacterium]MBW2346423.1 hydrogenase iron-sulfur subunit [Deltaproteobacteria bacterium]